MKKLLLLSLLAAGALTANAETVYIDDFSSCFDGSTFVNPPEGWSTQGSGTTFSISSDCLYGYTQYGATTSTILVTPALTGEVKVYGKGQSYSYSYGWDDEDGAIYFYTMTKNSDGSFKRGSIISGSSMTNTSFATKTFTVDPGTYVGIELSDAYLGSITYTPMQEGSDYSAMKVTKVEYPDGVTCLKSDYEGNVAYTLNVTVKNNGTTTLTPGMEGYSFSIYEKSTPAHVLGTYTPTESLEPGQEKVFTMSGTFPMATIMEDKGEPGTLGSYWCCLVVKDNISNTTAQSPWKDFYPMWILFDVYSGSDVTRNLDFGFVAPGTAVSKTISLRNKCINPLEVSYIQVPEGFTLETQLPFTVNPCDESVHSQDITISMDSDAEGVLSGPMVIYVGGAEEPLTVMLSGARPGSDNFFENFESGTTPAGWIIDNQLKVTSVSASVLGDGNTKALENSSAQNWGTAITPRLTAGENEYVVFQAGAKSNSSKDSSVKVYYSPDRSEWTLVKTIKNSAYAAGDEDKFSSDVPGYGSDGTALNLYSVAMPEGDGYLKFELMYSRIDNVFGAQLAEVDHDIMFEGAMVAGTPRVNNPLTVTSVINNIAANAEEANSYTLTLFANNEAVATMTETPELANGQNTVKIAYTPHAAGAVALRVELNSGDYSLSSPVIETNIEAESTNVIATVGDGEVIQSKSGSRTTPFFTYDKKSQCFMVYTEEQLAEAGITAGTNITGLSFYGANAETSKNLQGSLTVWMKPTELATLAVDNAPEVGDDNLVYNNESFVLDKIGTKDNPVEIINLTFDAPYAYAGGNLLICMVKVFDQWSSNVYFVDDAARANQAILRSNDTSYEDKTFNSTAGLAKLGVKYELEARTYAGSVVDSTNQSAIEGAEITLTSGDVIYNGVSAADGTFSIDVIQADKEYDVTVTKTDYNNYTGQVSFADGNVTATIELVPATGVGIEGINAESVNVRIADNAIFVEGIDNARLAIYSANGMAVASAMGNSISTAELQGGIYILRVESELGNANVRFIKR